MLQIQKMTVVVPQGTDRAKMHLLVQIESIINVQVNHYQLLFMMRFLETLGEITCFLTQDVRHILGEDDESSMVLGLCAPQVIFTTVLT